MKTHSRGRLFTGAENVKGRFIYDVSYVYEHEYPYRKCDRALFLHVLPRKALVLGWWKDSGNTEEHLLKALGGRELVQEKAGPADVGQKALR